ncbi:MAG TPA: hypothetical protein VGM26_10240 [Rhizomicrobium sp.]|jgi:hypothetical protein
MAADRSVRSLMGLSGASSSRVLNLAAIGLAQTSNPGHHASPLFESPVINGAIILKHRLRADEADLFNPRRAIATKLIIPFERTDMKQGGQSVFIGQRGFEPLLREVGNYGDKLEIKRDMEVLRLIDQVPSLDPFLLREHLRGNGVNPDPCYFEISASDQQRMFDYAAAEVGRLTALATGLRGGGGAGSASTARMVLALLSSEVNEKLEPLRATLNLRPEEFCEGVFSWRGFIYYKWSISEFWPKLIKTLREIKTIHPSGKVSAAEAAFMTSAKQMIISGARDNSNAVRTVIHKYDDAYAGMIDRRDPRLFREFLLAAPAMFLEIGGKMGAMAHVTSFWSYRFPSGAIKHADAEELMAIFQDFTKSFGHEQLEAA